jgi:glycosyltransferase involved in cell wall biosynthesis/thioredoxin-like negative regulator of GroEL
VRRGFVNIDLFSDDPSVVRMDIRRLELPDSSVDGLVAHDVLEHFSHREIGAVLREWARILKPGAEYMIRCPSLALQCRAYVNGVWDADVASFMIFGGQTNPGDFHCTGFDRGSITRHLEAAGFSIDSVQEEDTPQDRGFINLNMTVRGRKQPAERSPASPLRVVWKGEQFARHSLARVNREICARLASRPELELSLEGAGESPGKLEERFDLLRSRSSDPPAAGADVHVRHLWPAVLEPPPSGRWVVIQPWEYGSLPRAWVEAYRDQVDEFWVPSAFVRECYVQSGIPGERVVVIPNGVDGTVFRPGVHPLRLATKKKFRFLFVGGTLHRKGFDILLEAYGKAFTRRDSVCLVVKDMGGPELYEGVNARDLIREFTSDPDHPAIEYMDRLLTEEEMPALYAAADCLVHPYRGEGFGLPIAEAMASELPVIVTGAGAAMDFCTPETAFLLPARKGRLAARSIGGMETVDYPWLFEPAVDDLVRLMQYVRSHRAEARTRARAARISVLSSLSWEKAAELVAERLAILRTTPVRRTGIGAGTKNPLREPMTAPVTHIHPRVGAALARVRELQLQEHAAEAESILEALVRSHPSEPAVPLAFVRFLISTRQFEKASALISATPLALKSDPAWLEVTAECLEGTGDPQGADSCAERILERSPRSVPALTLRGRIAAGRGDLPRAERFLREAADIDPSAGEPRGLLGVLLLQRGETDEALSLLVSAFTLAPLNGDLLVTTVDALRDAGDLPRAAALLEEAARKHPLSKRLRYFHAELLAGLERYEESLRVVLEGLATFGVEDEALAFALELRLRVGPREISGERRDGKSVSACLIIKNEEQYLPRCLWSITPLVDEIVVVDTGSTDRSEEIAAAYGARITRVPWTGDFSEARNLSLEQAHGDWILVIDGDEVISSADQQAFRGLTSVPARRTAWSFVTRNYLIPMNVIGWISNDG